MAEAVLGAVASGAGLASLALQLFEVSQKLHELRANIRDAPAEVHEILDEVELLRTILSEYLNVSGVADKRCQRPTVVQKRALDQCFKVLKVLHNIAQELETSMRTSSSKRLINWAKVEAVFNRKRFEKLQTTLERAKSTLVLAVLTNPSSKPRVPESGIIIKEPAGKEPSAISNISTKSTNLEAPLPNTTTTNTSSWFAMYNIGIANVYVRSNNTQQRAEVDDNAPENGLKLSVSFASWLFNNAVALMFDCRPQSIRLALQIDRLVQPDAEIFHLCASGDAMGVRKSIADGRSSASDITYERVTPLMVASYYGHAEVCRVLLDAGADVNATTQRETIWSDRAQVTALYFALWSDDLPDASRSALQMHTNPLVTFLSKNIASGYQMDPPRVNSDALRVLVEDRRSCIEFGWSPPSCNAEYLYAPSHFTAVHHSICAVEDFSWLIMPERIGLVGLELDLFYMLMVRDQASMAPFSARRVFTAFSHVTDLSRLARIRDSVGTTVLWDLLSRLPYVEAEDQRCLLLTLEQLLQVGAIEITESILEWTPLMGAASLSIFRYMDRYGVWQPDHASQVLTGGLNLWLELLGRAKLDIRRYFATERQRGSEGVTWCIVETMRGRQFPEHFLDKEWYVQLSFQDKQATEIHDARGFRIEAKYHCEKRSYPMPGCFPGSDMEGSRHSAEDMDQLRVDEVSLEGSEDKGRSGNSHDGPSLENDDNEGDKISGQGGDLS